MKKNIFFFHSGGLGGSAGYYSFIQTYTNQSNSPKFIAKHGMNGQNGQNGRVCRSKGLTIRASSYKKHIVYDEIGWQWITDFTTDSFDDQHCSSGWIEPAQKPQNRFSSKQLDKSTAINAYKQFLIKNLKASTFVEIIRTAIDAIAKI